MNCRLFDDSLIELARGSTLLEPDAVRLEEHISVCAECRQRLEDQRTLSLAFQIMDQETQSSVASSRIEASLRSIFAASAASNNRRRFRPNPLTAAVAAVLIVFIAAALWLHTQRSTQINQNFGRSRAIDQQQSKAETTGVFFPLTYGELATDSYQLVRIKLPRSSLLQFGLPLNPPQTSEFIDAEVIIGDNGLPHAIRFLNGD